MLLANLKNIRQRKRISRKNFADMLNISISDLKYLEEEADEISTACLLLIGLNLKCHLYKLFDEQINKLYDSIFEEYNLNNNKIEQCNDLFINILHRRKSGLINFKDVINIFEEYKYYVYEIFESSSNKNIKRESLYKNNSVIDLLSQELNDSSDFSIDVFEGTNILSEDEILNLKKNSSSAAIIYKQLRDEGLDLNEAINILKVFLEINNNT